MLFMPYNKVQDSQLVVRSWRIVEVVGPHKKKKKNGYVYSAPIYCPASEPHARHWTCVCIMKFFKIV